MTTSHHSMCYLIKQRCSRLPAAGNTKFNLDCSMPNGTNSDYLAMPRLRRVARGKMIAEYVSRHAAAKGKVLVATGGPRQDETLSILNLRHTAHPDRTSVEIQPCSLDRVARGRLKRAGAAHTQHAGLRHRGLATCFPSRPELGQMDHVGHPFTPQAKVCEIR